VIRHGKTHVLQQRNGQGNATISGLNSFVDRNRRFEEVLLPHLDAAYNLARWLLRDGQAAQDVVQEACLRALRSIERLRGDDARPWLLGIVRNACFDHHRQRQQTTAFEYDDEREHEEAAEPADPRETPENLHLRKCSGAQVDAAIAALAPAFREVIVLRELEELSYEEIAHIAGIPVGTVMSRLSRARSLLRRALAPLVKDD
jgi:RNA polymerase sigma-70 factor (ECF subfamily)